MGALASDAADRVAAVLLLAPDSVPYGRLAAATGLRDATLQGALRRLAADGLVVRVAAGARPAWAADRAHPQYPALRAIYAKLAGDLPAALRRIVAGSDLVVRAVLADTRPTAVLVCVLADATSLDWYDVLGAISDAAASAGRALEVEGTSAEAFAAASPSDAVRRVRRGPATVLKG